MVIQSWLFSLFGYRIMSHALRQSILEEIVDLFDLFHAKAYYPNYLQDEHFNRYNILDNYTILKDINQPPLCMA